MTLLTIDNSYSPVGAVSKRAMRVLLGTVLWSVLGVFAAGAVDLREVPLYEEPYRPQYHFTPERHWMNDPNGMVYFEGEYHLFYQYNPFGNKWGHMSWGHAVSEDLMHWEHLPLALPEEDGVMIFSGSAVVDWNNTSNFGIDRKPPLVAIYTGHRPADGRQTQCLAFSNDRGRTWRKYAGNPVIDIESQNFRDPKVFWHEATGKWIMTVSLSVERKVRFYGSFNLKDWTHLSDFGPEGLTSGIWECPDLFPLSVEGSKKREVWVLIVNVGSGAPAGGSGCQYFVGMFDGKKFTLDEASRPKARPEFIPKGRLIADFDGEDYRDWKTTGTAFGAGPLRGAVDEEKPVAGTQGRGLANSFHGGDAAEGTLHSPPFELTHRYLSFLIRGGNHVDRTCLNLLVDGQVVRTATGDNNGHLIWKSWDVGDMQGQRAELEVVDRYTEGWGHISVDHILLADARARSAQEAALWADYGPDFYAAVSWSDIPQRDGRRLWLAWMSNWQYAQDVPTFPWRSAMTLPRALSLRQTTVGLRLVQEPVNEARRLRGRRQRLRNASLHEANEWLAARSPFDETFEMVIEWSEMKPHSEFGLRLESGPDEWTDVLLSAPAREITVDRSSSGQTEFHPKFADLIAAPLHLTDGTARLHLFGDASSLEIFANDGETSVTQLVFPSFTERRVNLFQDASGGDLKVKRIEIWPLESVWR